MANGRREVVDQPSKRFHATHLPLSNTELSVILDGFLKRVLESAGDTEDRRQTVAPKNRVKKIMERF